MVAPEEPQGPLPRDATKQEILDLVHEVDHIPITTWLLTFTGAAAQLARFGITVAWRESLEFGPNRPKPWPDLF
jgi:POT family proton-dependent oligopeptide transporter